MNIFNKILLSGAVVAVLALLLSLPQIDFTRNYTITLFYLFFIFASFFAIINLKKFILTAIFVLPTVIVFHNIKINLGIISSSLRNISLPANLTSLITVFLIYLAVITCATHYDRLKRLPLRFAIVPYFFFVLLSFLWVDNSSAGLIGIIYALGPLAIYILTNLYFTNKNDLITVWLTVIGSSLGPIAISLWQVLSNQFFYEPNSSLGRVAGSFVHPNLFGLYLFIIISLLITAYFALGKSASLKNKLFLYGLVLSLVFILTFSRTAWLCAGIFLLLFAFLEKQLFILIALLAPVGLFFSIAIDSLRERIWGLSNYVFFNSVIARQNIWHVSYQEFAKSPVLGYGVGTSESVIENAKEWSGGTSLPHNDYILHALEFGLIGLSLYLNYLVQTIRELFKTYQKTPSKPLHHTLGKIEFSLNRKTLAYGIFIIFIALQGATMFESVSREIILEISVWAIIGTLLAQQKNPA